MSRQYRFEPRKFTVEFRDWRQASAHGGQLDVAALLEEFGLTARAAACGNLEPLVTYALAQPGLGAKTRWLAKR
jgi:hypothetical protein